MRNRNERLRHGAAGVAGVVGVTGVAALALAGLRAWAASPATVTPATVESITATAPAASAASAASAPESAVADPLRQYTTHLVATHYLRDESYETHHYFKPLRDGVLQGLVFRGTAEGMPLIEVEWAISEAVFGRLPDWQKAFWHPLAPAVDAGRVRLPDLSPEQEREMLGTVRGLYAQTINLAGLDGELPIGLEGIALATHITRAEMLRAMGASSGR
ncbi:MAG TPA: DUF1264 domain-containing protein [Longimicrobiales bacterium]